MSARAHIAPFRGEADLAGLNLPPRNRDAVLANVAAYEASTVAATVWLDGRPVACGGIMSMGWQSRAYAWFLPGGRMTRAVLRKVIPAILAGLENAHAAGCVRIEATVPDWFLIGQGFAEHFGFQREGLMRSYAPDGGDHVLYARVVP